MTKLVRQVTWKEGHRHTTCRQLMSLILGSLSFLGLRAIKRFPDIVGNKAHIPVERTKNGANDSFLVAFSTKIFWNRRWWDTSTISSDSESQQGFNRGWKFRWINIAYPTNLKFDQIWVDIMHHKLWDECHSQKAHTRPPWIVQKNRKLFQNRNKTVVNLSSR
jgi:hypothetical protein